MIYTISNGPSARNIDIKGADTVIAVNKAATLYKADWWVVSDASCFIDHHRAVMDRHGELTPMLFTRECVRDQIIGLFNRPDLADVYDRWPGMMQSVIRCEGMPFDKGTAWNQWSGLAALGLTYILARRWKDSAHSFVDVVLAGYDLEGDADCVGDGTSIERHSRSMSDRWSRERQATQAWIDLIRNTGVRMTHGKDGEDNPSRQR